MSCDWLFLLKMVFFYSYGLMSDCWIEEADDRPMFIEVVTRIARIIEAHLTPEVSLLNSPCYMPSQNEYRSSLSINGGCGSCTRSSRTVSQIVLGISS